MINQINFSTSFFQLNWASWFILRYPRFFEYGTLVPLMSSGNWFCKSPISRIYLGWLKLFEFCSPLCGLVYNCIASYLYFSDRVALIPNYCEKCSAASNVDKTLLFSIYSIGSKTLPFGTAALIFLKSKNSSSCLTLNNLSDVYALRNLTYCWGSILLSLNIQLSCHT